MVRASVSICRHQVHVLSPSWRVEREMWVHGGHFTSVGIHAAGCLTGLDVTPYHRCHVAFVVHEPSIKVRCIVRVRSAARRSRDSWRP